MGLTDPSPLESQSGNGKERYLGVPLPSFDARN